jgi:dephospho-CoA kinase
LKSSRRKDFLIVGVTGGIGGGKTAVCDLFEQLGRTVISADKIARDLTERDESIRGRIRAAFGEGVYDANGILDRAALATLVFADARRRKVLNAIVHPAVFRTIDERLKSLSERQRHPYVLIEAALIYETGMDKQLDYVIVVDAGRTKRIQRVIRRDRVPREQVMKRMEAQMPVELKRARADFVIENNSELGALHSKVFFLDAVLVTLARSKGH